MSKVRALIFVIALSTPALAMAAEPEPTAAPFERRLSSEQIEQVLADAARRREGSDRAAEPPVTSESQPMAVHGEVGISIGTGGHRSAFGTAYIGLPGDGAAILSVGGQRRSSDPYLYPPN